MQRDMRFQMNEAIKALLISRDEFDLVSLHKYQEILTSIVERFTTQGKKGLSALWWWDNLKEPTYGMQTKYAPSLLMDIVPCEERIWFVAEDWGNTKRHGNFWLYEGTIQAAVAIINEMFGFEYYIVSKKLEWLLCENHHDILIGAGQPIIDRMKQLNSKGRT